MGGYLSLRIRVYTIRQVASSLYLFHMNRQVLTSAFIKDTMDIDTVLTSK